MNDTSYDPDKQCAECGRLGTYAFMGKDVCGRCIGRVIKREDPEKPKSKLSPEMLRILDLMGQDSATLIFNRGTHVSSARIRTGETGEAKYEWVNNRSADALIKRGFFELIDIFHNSSAKSYEHYQKATYRIKRGQ